ncbi:MAG: tRNA pseudouridine(38-40) synthase TruA, partial [Gammaproteobacteria bacterium]
MTAGAFPRRASRRYLDGVRIAVGLEYDGTLYAGWQTQPSLRTVQEVVEAALGRVAAQPVSLIC